MTVGEENESNLDATLDPGPVPPAPAPAPSWTDASAAAAEAVAATSPTSTDETVPGVEADAPERDSAPEAVREQEEVAAMPDATAPQVAVEATPVAPPVAKRASTPAAPAERPSRPAKPGPMKWYVVQVYSGYEQKVKASLLERIKQASMEPYFGEILIPTETVQDVQGRRKVASRTFYPGYIFVQMALGDEVWHVVRDTPKVTGFVGGRTPQPVPAPEIQSVVQQVEEGAAKPRPRVVFATGDHVRVNDGAFANFTGTVEQVNPDKQKVRVLVSIFGRATPVELDYTQVEKTA